MKNLCTNKRLGSLKKGTKVIFIPGNHDEAARKYIGINFGDIKIQDEADHSTLDGKRLWVIHGDQFDGIMQHARWLAHIGDKGYSTLIRINNLINKIRNIFNLPYWSLSKYIKLKVKKAVSFVTAFEKRRFLFVRSCNTWSYSSFGSCNFTVEETPFPI